MAYLYNYDYRTQDSQIKVFNLKAGKTERENFITDGTTIRTPLQHQCQPYSGNVYITDAYDYKVKGDVLCFSPQGQLIFKLPNVGINSNTVPVPEQSLPKAILTKIRRPGSRRFR